MNIVAEIMFHGYPSKFINCEILKLTNAVDYYLVEWDLTKKDIRGLKIDLPENFQVQEEMIIHYRPENP